MANPFVTGYKSTNLLAVILFSILILTMNENAIVSSRGPPSAQFAGVDEIFKIRFETSYKTPIKNWLNFFYPYHTEGGQFEFKF